ncbi:MAG TPA: prolyl oligopeptidase family serine peptidase [Pirellulales bacterium]
MTRTAISRRCWLTRSAAAAAALYADSIYAGRLLAADSDVREYAPLNRAPRMVQEYMVREVRKYEHRLIQRQANLDTKAAAEAYVRRVRAKIDASFGPWPERTPLNPQITGVVQRDGYRIENLIFESRPKFFVTGNLYLPKQQHAGPAVVGVCGHSPNGKAWPTYQSFAQGLVRQGYVVLIFDPIGQGERLQLPDEHLKSRIYPGTGEHLSVGNQQSLVGEFFGAWRAWDGMRALDYLLTREEVDQRHLGVTGSSGGGTMSTWLAGVDRRFTMAAPSSFLTTFRRNLENEYASDSEQCPPRAIALGLDEVDFLAAMAPNPCVILGQEQDAFDIRGTIEAHQRLKHIYTLLGAPDAAELFVGPGPHGYSQDAREAMYACFNRASGLDHSATEPPIKLEDEQTLRCTKSGQVVELKSRPVYSFTHETADKLASTRSAVSGEALKQVVRDILRLPDRKHVPGYRILRAQRARGYPRSFVSIFAVETEPGIQAFVYRPTAAISYSRPPRAKSRAVLYVAHDSSDAELRNEPLLKELLADPERAIYTCDVRGLGESRPNTCGENQYASHYGSDYMYAAYSNMLDRPYAGRRTHDVLAVIDWITSFGHADLHLVGKGYGAIPAAFAALLHPAVAQVTLKQPLDSYQAIASAELYKWPLSAFIPGVLKHFDLPDIYRALKAKGLRLIEPLDSGTKPK